MQWMEHAQQMERTKMATASQREAREREDGKGSLCIFFSLRSVVVDARFFSVDGHLVSKTRRQIIDVINISTAAKQLVSFGQLTTCLYREDKSR